jgi:DNA polymerase III delta subunit
MLYVMHGTGYEKARSRTRDLTDALQKKKPDVVFFRVTNLNYAENPLSFLVAGQGLFESKYIVLLDNLFESKDIKEEIVGALKEIKASDNIFILLEKEIDKKTLDKLEKHSEKVQEFSSSEAKKRNDYNPFAISDAILNRDKKSLWMIILDAKKRGGAPEETHGIIWWQVKAMKLARETPDAKDADLSPFVYAKAKKVEKNFSDEEINKMAFDLVAMYHEAHRGAVDLWDELEKWGLKC